MRAYTDQYVAQYYNIFVRNWTSCNCSLVSLKFSYLGESTMFKGLLSGEVVKFLCRDIIQYKKG